MAFSLTRLVSIAIPAPLDVAMTVVKPARDFLRRQRARRQIVALLEAETFVLDDIGVARDDVRAALRQGGDPALALRRIARERRMGMRARRPL